MNKAERELIDAKFDRLETLIVGQVSIQSEVNRNLLDSSKRIEAQTTRTNGRVLALERFQWTLTGKIIGISSAIGVIFGVITFIFS